MKLGVFGGSFDPPHAGHLMVAQDALEDLRLDLLLLVPARVSPFKAAEAQTPGPVRAEMLEGALLGHPRMRVWRGELERNGPSYTVDTLEAIRQEFREAELHLIVGQDQWKAFPGWHEARRILELARVCVLTREDGAEGTSAAMPSEHEWPHTPVRSRRVDVSSSEIRRRVGEGRSVRYLVPETVRNLINQQRLYGSAGPHDGVPVLPHS